MPAGKARKQRKWLRTLLVYLLFPIFIWTAAFLVWFYWHNLTRHFAKTGDKPNTVIKLESSSEAREKVDSKKPEPVQEKILDEDRRKLEDILKQRQ